MADSGYEYLLKQWLLSGDMQAREQCEPIRCFAFPKYNIFSSRYQVCERNHQQSDPCHFETRTDVCRGHRHGLQQGSTPP